MILIVMYVLLANPTVADPRLPVPIENCDGSGQRSYGGLPHEEGGEWFSLKGKVLDQQGNPVCGAWVRLEYLQEMTTQGGTIHGPVSATGLNGEFFLDNVHKGTPFKLVVNPYEKLERHARSEGLSAVESFVKAQHNVRTGGLARHESDELKSAASSGLMTFDIKLEEDPAATGIVAGKVGVEAPYDVEAPALARVLVAGRAPIEVPVDRRTGEFVIFGVPAGQHRVDVEVSKKRQRHAMSKTVTVLDGKDSVSRVELLAK